MKRAEAPPNLRDRLFTMWLVSALLVLILGVWSPAGVERGEGEGEPRKVDMSELERRLESGRLSREPARHSKRPSQP